MAAVLLSGSSCRVRPSSNDPLTPVLFLETLLELEPRLADRLSVVRWPRHDAAVTHAAASAADGVVASGDDETIDAIAPHARRLIGYGHRRSVALIGAGALADADALADRLARDVCFYEQQGCLSPHVVYVEEGGAVPPIEFARRLARALELMAKHWPPAPIPLEAAGVILQLQAELEFQEAIGAQALSTNGGTVLYDPDPAPRPSPGYRTIWLKPVGQIDHALDALQTWQGRIESAGIALAGERVDAIRPRLDRLGVNRLCEIGAMQTPPLRWRLIDQGLLPQLFRWNAVCSAATS